MTTSSHDKNPWWREAIIYQVYPRSYLDTNGDGVGDLPGITAKLDYIASLGVDIVWLSPFFKSPMKDFGYDIADYCDVDPLFGTLADFDALVAKAHSLGLKIMIDQVMAHTAENHPWFVESRSSRDNPKADWYVWSDPLPDGNPPNNWLSVFGGPAWQWDSRRKQYYMHNFLVNQPQVNFHHPAVQQAHLDSLRFWLERGVDGVRMDACNFHFHDRSLQSNPPALVRDTSTVTDVNPYGMQAHIHDKTQPENIAFLQRLRKLLDEYGAVAIGEVGADDSLAVMADYTSGGDKLHMAYSFNLLTPQFSSRHIRRQVEEFNARVKDGWASWSVGNHDSIRVATRWSAGEWTPALSKLVLALQLSLKGTPCLYQGDELALPEADVPYELLQDPYGITFWPEFKGRDGCRTPMPWTRATPNAGFTTGKPWLPVPPEHVCLAEEGQDKDPQSTLNFARNIIQWRRGLPQLTRGDIAFFDVPEQALALRRDEAGFPSVLAVFNVTNAPLTFDWPEAAGAKKLEGHGLSGDVNGTTVTLPPYGGWFGTIA
ncbi:alpha-glucosidase [Massilia sp. Root133]|uniref:Alpha-glucosidase n=1 Tax=Massilia cellulosiltytica TaxID=2683234 RepID=A0A7X3G0Y5_9BURK|nr:MULTISPECIES: alpha-amylase family glycosyl hydrolase [Telluria group]KQY05794.1 alpha-glucosidase [Massilia sp. Root133]KQZ52245.1 alpha-glucosidase [Massilia sp. Root1485]MVW61019.1 alpha-glucosidase [Telluria cellulosilytica]